MHQHLTQAVQYVRAGSVGWAELGAVPSRQGKHFLGDF